MSTRSAAMLVAIAGVAAAQTSVKPERPTVATHAGTVAPGYLEFEWGVDYADGPTLSIPLYFKLGLKRNAQFGMLLPFVKPGSGDLGLGDLMFALKWRLVDKNPLLGDFAIQPAVSLPTAEGSDESQVSFQFLSSRMLDQVSLDLNAGVLTGPGDGALATWAIALRGPVSGKMGWIGEVSGASNDGASSSTLLLGPSWRIRRTFALDAGIILPLEPATDLRLYFGGVSSVGRLVGR